MNEYLVSLDWDAETARWYALNDDIPIMLEDASLDALIYRVKLATPELLELNGKLRLARIFHGVSSRGSASGRGYKARVARATKTYRTICLGDRASATQ